MGASEGPDLSAILDPTSSSGTTPEDLLDQVLEVLEGGDLVGDFGGIEVRTSRYVPPGTVFVRVGGRLVGWIDGLADPGDEYDDATARTWLERAGDLVEAHAAARRRR